MLKRKYLPFELLVIAIVLLAILPSLIAEGMFVDGILYSCVARNLAAGEGTFWFPLMHHLDILGLSSFHEQPPLGFFLESVFFRIFGDGIYTERIFTVVLMVIAALLIISIWKLIIPDTSRKGMAWLPLFFWLITPTLFWSYQHAILENTMVVFVLLAIFSSLKVLKDPSRWLPWLLFAGFNIFLASLSKGITGIFPLVFFALYFLFSNEINFKKALIYSLVLLSVPVVIYLLLMQFEAPDQSLRTYFFERLVGRVNDTPTVSSRFSILGNLFNDLLPMLIIFLVLWLIKAIRSRTNSTSEEYASTGLFMMSLGLAGSLPLLLTKVQKPFYYAPAIPLFALGFALLALPYIDPLLTKLHERAKTFSIVLIISATLVLSGIILSISAIGSFSREEIWIKDIKEIGRLLPERTVVSSSDYLSSKWSVKFYFDRYERIYINNSIDNEYLIVTDENDVPKVKSYEQIETVSERILLFRNTGNN